MISLRLLAAAALAISASAVALFIVSGAFHSEAVQAPRVSLDMVTTGNTYSDPGAGGDNSMTAGAIDQCVTETLNNAAHNRTLNHLIIQNVEDLAGWQVRLNYLANRMRFTSFNSTPFNDTNNSQPVGFLNLPIASSTHGSVVQLSKIDRYPETSVSVPSLAGATTITVGSATGFAPGQTIGIGTPANRETGRTVSAVTANPQQITFSPALVNDHLGLATEVVNVTDPMPQTALIGATYVGAQTFAISPDTPAKPTPDDTSYTANTGGVLANLVLRIEPDQGGQPSLFMNLDDNSPNPPGSAVVIFNGAGTTEINLASSALGDGFVGQGPTCVPLDCTTQECPHPATPNPPQQDSDGDGVLDINDNCPRWPNPAQNLPPWPVPANDPECDGFSNTVESSAGTDALVQCGTDAWPADVNNDTFSDISDVSALTGNFGRAVPPAPYRQNIAPDPPDGFVDITDVSKLTSFFGFGCTPCANDFDCDTVLNAADNCPNWPNRAQNLPPWSVPANDPDCDGFSTVVESSAGTNFILHCGANAWPADLNNDGFSDIADISPLFANYGLHVPPAPARYDIAPDPPDHVVDLPDISRMVVFFGEGCN